MCVCAACACAVCVRVLCVCVCACVRVCVSMLCAHYLRTCVFLEDHCIHARFVSTLTNSIWLTIPTLLPVLLAQSICLIVALGLFEHAPIDYQTTEVSGQVYRPDGVPISTVKNISGNIFIGAAPSFLLFPQNALFAPFLFLPGPCVLQIKHTHKHTHTHTRTHTYTHTHTNELAHALFQSSLFPRRLPRSA